MSTIGNPSAFTKRCDTCHPGAGGPWRAPIGMTPAPISPPPAGRVMSATCRPYSSSGAPVAPRLCGVFGPACKHKLKVLHRCLPNLLQFFSEKIFLALLWSRNAAPRQPGA